jgi:hypothetical protein
MFKTKAESQKSFIRVRFTNLLFNLFKFTSFGDWMADYALV